MIDALVISAHKLYAYAGIGALVVRREALDCDPPFWGGGTVDMVRWEDDASRPYVLPSPPTERHNPGSPFAEGQVALGLACEQLAMRIGWPEVQKHERGLIAHTVKGIRNLDGLLELPFDPNLYLEEDRVATFPFLVRLPDDPSRPEAGPMHHAKLGAILQHEYGIETRSGTICNHPLNARWHEVGPSEQRRIEHEMEAGNRLASYGVLRVSLGLCNEQSDIDRFVNAVREIAAKPHPDYRPRQDLERYDWVHAEPPTRQPGESLRGFLTRILD